MTRQEANKEILTTLTNAMHLYPDARFGQILQFLNITISKINNDFNTYWVDEYYLESEELLKRMTRDLNKGVKDETK